MLLVDHRIVNDVTHQEAHLVRVRLRVRLRVGVGVGSGLVWLTHSSALSESTRTPPRGSGRGSRLEQSYLVSSR